MIKKTLILGVVLTVVLLAMAAPALAAPGGMPAAHGLYGAEWGMAVSELAKSAPGAVAAHKGVGAGSMEASASMAGGNGMPALHGVDGKTFGGLVSGLAKMYPGAVAAHIQMFK